MTWTLLSDNDPERLFGLSDSAFRLYVCSLVAANRLEWDDRIPKQRLGLVSMPQRSRRPAVVKELVKAGYWIDDGDAWTIVDFFKVQSSVEEKRAKREYDAARQRISFARKNKKPKEFVDGLVTSADEYRLAWFDAAERRRARASQCESRGESHCPIQSSPVLSGPSEDKDKDRTTSLRPLEGRPRSSDEDAAICPRCHEPIDYVNDKTRHVPWPNSIGLNDWLDAHDDAVECRKAQIRRQGAA